MDVGQDRDAAPHTFFGQHLRRGDNIFGHVAHSDEEQVRTMANALQLSQFEASVQARHDGLVIFAQPIIDRPRQLPTRQHGRSRLLMV